MQLPQPALEDGDVLQTARTNLLERRRAWALRAAVLAPLSDRARTVGSRRSSRLCHHCGSRRSRRGRRGGGDGGDGLGCLGLLSAQRSARLLELARDLGVISGDLGQLAHEPRQLAPRLLSGPFHLGRSLLRDR